MLRFGIGQGKTRGASNFTVLTSAERASSITLLSDNTIAAIDEYDLVICNSETFNVESRFPYSIFLYGILELPNNKIACPSEDSKIIIINKLDNNKLELYQTLEGHNQRVHQVILLENKDLCSCSFDGSIIIWKLNEENKYILHKKIIVGKIRQCTKFDMKTMKMENVEAARFVDSICQVSSNLILCSSNSFVEKPGYVKFVNIDNGTIEKKIMLEIGNWITMVKINDDYVFIGGLNLIYLIKISEMKKVKEIDCKIRRSGNVTCVYKSKDNKYIYAGITEGSGDNASSRLFKYVIDGDDVKEEKRGFDEPDLISCICKLDNGKIITGPKVKVIDDLV